MARAIGMDLTSGSLFKKMARFSVPLIFTHWLQIAFNFADVIVVGKLVSDLAVGAVGSTGSLTALIVALFLGISLGSNIVIAKAMGENNQEKVRRLVGVSIFISIFFGVVLSIIGVLFSRTFLIWMDTPDTLLDMASLYLKVIFIGAPAKLLYNFCASILRASGETVKPMIFLAIGGVINILLNIFSITVLGMTVDGVALATVSSELVAAILCLIVLLKNQGVVKLCPKHIRFYKSEFIEILKQGIPSGIQSCMFSLSNVIVQSSINSFGDIVVSGNSYASQIEHFVYFGFNAFSTGTMCFVSQNYGARNVQNIKKSFLYGLFYAVTVGFVLSMVGYIFSRQLLSLLTSNPDVIKAGVDRMRYVCKLYFLCGFMEVISYSLKGLGKSTSAMVANVVGTCLFRIIWLKTVLKFYHVIDMVYIVYLLSWLLSIIIQAVMLLREYKKIKIRFANTDNPSLIH